MTTPIAASSPSPVARWRIVVLLMAFAAFGHFNRVGISVAGSEVFIPQLGLSETRMGWVYTAFLIVYTIGMLPGGWLIDRIGSARTLTLYGLSMGTFVALTGTLGWITSDAESLWIGLLIVRSLAGLCSAPLHPGAAHQVSELMPERSRATANGLVTAGALIGIAFSYPAFGGLMDLLNWPLAFVVSGLLFIGYSLLWRKLTSPVSRDLPPAPASAVGESDPTGGWSLLWQINLWLLSLSYAAYGYFQYLFFYWMDYYFKSVLHVPDVEARWASFWIMLAMGAGMAIGGMSTDFVCQKLGKARGRRAIVVFGMGVGAAFALLGVNVTGQINVAMCLAISMASLGMCEGVFWTTATDIGGKSRGFSGAFMNTGGNVGGLISPVLTPMMAQKMGWPGAITVACVIAGLGGAVWFAIRLPEPPATEA
jgi:ACS family D-galactonate transporter-like MFS transporter